jgi:homoserine dehydrogenase
MNVAILGLGVVGKGVYDLLQEQPDINILYVLERNQDKTQSLVTTSVTSISTIVNDPNVDIVIELIGGLKDAYEMITSALEHGKHVVTANKAVISRYFKPLHELAKTNHVHLLYEASVGGGIVVLDSLKTIASINHIYRVEGIVNGATNVVLSSVFQTEQTLDEALQKALELGYIETGTTDDMDGLDAMRKIHILSNLSYQTYLNQNKVDILPLSSITSRMINYVKSIHHEMKYIVSSSKTDDKVHMSVLPTVYETINPYQDIQYEENIISVFGQYHQKQSFIGQGAGRYPTASAVVYDILQIKQGTVSQMLIQEDPNKYTKQHYSFLVESKTGFYVTKPMTLQDALAIEDAICIARWEGQL